VASLLIFGPSQVFACELKLDLKYSHQGLPSLGLQSVFFFVKS
jgi:hypothetical protein